MGVKNAGRFMHNSPPLKSDKLVIGLSLFVNSLGISSGEIPVAIDAVGLVAPIIHPGSRVKTQAAI